MVMPEIWYHQELSQKSVDLLQYMYPKNQQHSVGRRSWSKYLLLCWNVPVSKRSVINWLLFSSNEVLAWGLLYSVSLEAQNSRQINWEGEKCWSRYLCDIILHSDKMPHNIFRIIIFLNLKDKSLNQRVINLWAPWIIRNSGFSKRWIIMVN